MVRDPTLDVSGFAQDILDMEREKQKPNTKRTMDTYTRRIKVHSVVTVQCWPCAGF